jgi:heme exporter protein CcmD
MENTPYFSYILGAYGASALCLGALVLSIFAQHRRARRTLLRLRADLEETPS